MHTKRLFFVGIPETHVVQSIQRAQRLGYEVIVGDTEQRLATYRHLLTGADRCVVTDYTSYDDLAAVTAELHAESPLDAIFSFKELALVPTARIATAYNMVSNVPAAVEICIDKVATRDRLKQAGLLSPAYAFCSDVREVVSFYQQVGGAVIVKPANLQGSVCVTKAMTEQEAVDAYYRCTSYTKQPGVLVEEFLLGQEISIEAMVYRGEVVLFGVTEKLLYPGTFVEAGHISPYEGAELSRAEYTTLVGGIVDALGITFGPLHIEGFHTPKGFIVGEVHTRYGGDSIVTLTELAMKVDLTTPIFAELANLPHTISFGQPAEVAAVRYLDVQPGVISAVHGLKDVQSIPGVIAAEVTAKVGDTVRPVSSSFDRVGWVIVQAATRAEVTATLKHALRVLRVETV